MSQENVEIVRRAMAALGPRTRDLVPHDPVLQEFFDPEVEWLPAAQSLLAASTYRGYEGISRFWAELFSAWDEYVVEPQEFLEVGEQVVVIYRIRARTREIEIDEVWSGLFALRDKRLIRFEGFSTRDAALEAAGLES
jgi:ketosteroid isomerase-like protein